jgi:hypothetical protein
MLQCVAIADGGATAGGAPMDPTAGLSPYDRGLAQLSAPGPGEASGYRFHA